MFFKSKKKEKEELKELIRQGILYEDEFITQYSQLLKEQEYLDAFKDDQQQAKDLLSVLSEESEMHKRGLVNVLDKL